MITETLTQELLLQPDAIRSVNVLVQSRFSSVKGPFAHSLSSTSLDMYIHLENYVAKGFRKACTHQYPLLKPT
jgi:hypothetical protein